MSGRYAASVVVAVAQNGPHGVHLGMGRDRGASRAIDRLEHDRRLADTQAPAAVFLGNENGEPSPVRQRLDELLGILALVVEPDPIVVAEFAAQLRDRIANGGLLGRHPDLDRRSGPV